MSISIRFMTIALAAFSTIYAQGQTKASKNPTQWKSFFTVTDNGLSVPPKFGLSDPCGSIERIGNYFDNGAPQKLVEGISFRVMMKIDVSKLSDSDRKAYLRENGVTTGFFFQSQGQCKKWQRVGERICQGKGSVCFAQAFEVCRQLPNDPDCQ